jgi:hypothetical protein
MFLLADPCDLPFQFQIETLLLIILTILQINMKAAKKQNFVIKNIEVEDLDAPCVDRKYSLF